MANEHSYEYRQGLAARDDEEALSSNPFEPGTREHKDWAAGWQSSDAAWLEMEQAEQQQRRANPTATLDLLRDAHDLLDGALGDSDVHYEDDEEEREYAPVQVAARLVAQAIQQIETD